MEAAVRWSPHSTGDRERFLVVDVRDGSLKLNQVRSRQRKHINYDSVARIDRLPNFAAFDWSKTDESIISLGLVSGSACLVQLREDGRQSKTVTTYKLRQQRKCTSIALSRMNWLAVALDRARSDNSLNVFDAASDHPEPVRRLCPGEIVSSVRYFSSQPEEIVVAAQKSLIRLYDLRDGFFGNTSNVQIPTRNVNNIAVDPCDENYFASAGPTDDPSVTVWDKRWIHQTTASSSNSGAVFDFRPAVDNSERTTVWSLRYSGQRRGRLAICSSRGELNVIDMVEGPDSQHNASDYLSSNPHGGLSWNCNRYVSQTREVEKSYQPKEQDALDDKRLIAFDWIVDHDDQSQQSVLALRPDRKADVLRVPSFIPEAGITARSDLSLAFDDITITEARADMEPTKSGISQDQRRFVVDSGPREHTGAVASEAEGNKKLKWLSESPQLNSFMTSATTHRDRCRRGYLFDCSKNLNIIAGDWQLERLWEIVNHFRTLAADAGMIAESLDLSFVGVTGICLGEVGNLSRRTLSPSLAKVGDAVSGLSSSRELPPFEGERTEYPEHRQLALELCGWKFTTESLEHECQDLIDRGLYYQAIVQAVLHGYTHVALNLLRTLIRSKTIANIGLGVLLASDIINEQQKEMCQWMMADTDDPALKALLIYLSTGNWRDVMKSNYLHLGYRVALGLKYLNDSELHGFLQTETARAVKNGNLEGVLLTGLGEQVLDLFQAYIVRTNDLQTAVLATAFSHPRYVNDSRWEMWKETYFMQMQSWRAFIERTRFVVQHTRMLEMSDSQRMSINPAAQVTLRCTHCRQPVAKNDGTSRTIRSKQLQASGKNNDEPQIIAAESAGVICQNCGRHMPRCGICKMWLGTPDAGRRGGAKELQKLSDKMAKFLTFCVRCQHGFHAHHAQSWFGKHSTCPVPDCRCTCMVMR